MRVLLIAAALAVIAAIFLSMPAGRRLALRLGLPGLAKGGPPREDRRYLLELCGNDRQKVAQLLEAERRKFSDLTEAQIYRRVIRNQVKLRGSAVATDDF